MEFKVIGPNPIQILVVAKECFCVSDDFLWKDLGGMAACRSHDNKDLNPILETN